MEFDSLDRCRASRRLLTMRREDLVALNDEQFQESAWRDDRDAVRWVEVARIPCDERVGSAGEGHFKEGDVVRVRKVEVGGIEVPSGRPKL